MTKLQRIRASLLSEQLLGVSEIQHRKKRRQRRRRFEALETRELLAVDATWPFVAVELDLESLATVSDAAASEIDAADVNQDQHISAGDGLLLVNALNSVFAAASDDTVEFRRFDVSGDGKLADDDFLAFVAVANHKSSQVTLAPAANDSPISAGQSDPDDPTDGGAGSSGGNDSGGHSDQDDPSSGDTTGGSQSGGDTTGGGPSGDSTTPTTPPSGGSSGGSGGSGSGSGSGGSADTPPTTGQSGPSPVDDQTGSGGPDCSHRLSGKTVNEGESFDLPLTLAENCVTEYRVDWGDGTHQLYQAGEIPRYVYMDDNPANTPADNYNVVVTVGHPNGSATRLETVVTVNNVAPIAFDDDATTTEDRLIFITALENDRDPSLADHATLTISNVDTTGTVGAITQFANGVFRYDPQDNFQCLAEGETATDSFRYTIHDDDEPAKKSTATVNILIEGRRERYLLTYGAAGQGREEGEQAVPLDFSITPQVVCDPVEVTYRRTNYTGVADLPEASDEDVKDPVGTVRFEKGQASGRATVTPVDDQVIEENEWFFFAVDAERNDDYEIVPAASEKSFKIDDNEWRFTAGAKSESAQFGPIRVEAFSKYGVSSILSGNFSLNSTLDANIGSTGESTARVRADNAALLTRPGGTNNQAGDFAQITFHCDSQNGDIWRDWVLSGGSNNSSPLSTTVGMEYQVNDIGSEQAIAVVDVSFEFLAGGTISKSFTPGLQLQFGDKNKGQTGGSISLQRTVSYAGGAEHRVGDGFTLRCQRGPAN